MKPDFAFTCPLTRADLIGEGAIQHCPQCDLDVPDMSALTRAEAERVLGALRCAHELSADLHFCSSYELNADGDAVFFEPGDAPAGMFDMSNLVDTTPKLLLAIAAISALGLTAQLHVFQNILAPAWEGHPVLVLDADGPRLEPERAEAFSHAVDASEDAWLTINIAAWRQGAVRVLFPTTTYKFEKANASINSQGVDF